MSNHHVSLASFTERIRTSETFALSAIAVLLGLAAGVGIWIFKSMIDFFTEVAFTDLGGLLGKIGPWTVFIIPILGGLLVGLLAYYFMPEEKLHGTASIMESVALAGGRLRYKRVPLRILASSLSIGFGGSVGPEDPSVQLGANLGSMFGQVLRLSDDRTRTLVAAGAAAGIAAAFNAPIAGVFFALEIVMGQIGSNALGVVLIASVASAVFTQAVSGAQPAFRIPAYAFLSARELPLYLILGLLAGPLSAGYVHLLYKMQDFFHTWDIPRWIKPAAAGLAVGLAGIFLPRIFGTGYDTIDTILNSTDLTLLILAGLLVAKLILTPVSIGGGFAGGVFAPALFLGATLGGAYGLLVRQLLPSMPIAPAAFALVGMAAVLAGAVHAPLTAIILLFEMTNDYHIILPLMFAVAVSLLISQRLQKDSVYALGLARHGIRLDRGRDVEVLDALTVEEIMHNDLQGINENAGLVEATEKLTQTRRHGLPVFNDNHELVGIFTLQDVDIAIADERSEATIGEVCTRKLIVTYPDESLGLALRKMSRLDIGRIPVVERNNPGHLVGMLRRADIVHAYSIALARREQNRHRAHRVRLDAVTPEQVAVSEIIIERGAICVGKKMKEVTWPKSSVIASLRRNSQVLIPRGETTLQAGDILIVVAEGTDREDIYKLCQRQPQT